MASAEEDEMMAMLWIDALDQFLRGREWQVRRREQGGLGGVRVPCALVLAAHVPVATPQSRRASMFPCATAVLACAGFAC